MNKIHSVIFHRFKILCDHKNETYNDQNLKSHHFETEKE